MAEREGLWPGVVAVVSPDEFSCVPCARALYGRDMIQALVNGNMDHRHVTEDGEPLCTVLLYGSVSLHGAYCCQCGEKLCDEDCLCYQPGQMEYWNEHYEFQEGK